MPLDRETTQRAISCMEGLLTRYAVMDWSAPVRVPDYASFKLAIFQENGFPFPPVYLPFAMVACELQCEAIMKKDQETGKGSDEGFAAFMKRKLLHSIEEMLSAKVQAVLDELRKPENIHLGQDQSEAPAAAANSVDDLPKALTILNDRLRRYSSSGEPDRTGFLREAQSWTADAYGSPFALATAIALTEMQCEMLIEGDEHNEETSSKAAQAGARLLLLKQLRATLTQEIAEYVDAAKARLPKTLAAEMPWH